MGSKVPFLGLPHWVTLWEKSLQYLLRDSVGLCSWVNFYGHLICSLLCNQLEHGVEGGLAIRCSISEQDAFLQECQGDNTVRLKGAGTNSLLSW